MALPHGSPYRLESVVQGLEIVPEQRAIQPGQFRQRREGMRQVHGDRIFRAFGDFAAHHLAQQQPVTGLELDRRAARDWQRQFQPQAAARHFKHAARYGRIAQDTQDGQGHRRIGRKARCATFFNAKVFNATIFYVPISNVTTFHAALIAPAAPGFS